MLLLLPKIYLSRVRWEKLRGFFECSVLMLTPLISIFSWRHASVKSIARISSAFLASGLTCLFLTSEPQYLARPNSYFLFLNAGKIVAYSYNDIARLIVQPMFSWAFVQSLAVFVITLLATIAVEFMIRKWRLFYQRKQIG